MTTLRLEPLKFHHAGWAALPGAGRSMQTTCPSPWIALDPGIRGPLGHILFPHAGLPVTTERSEAKLIFDAS
jgi:hypothetical protein